MPVVADRLNRVKPSETKAMTARATALRASGRSVITMSQGEPDFDTPEHVREAGARAIREGLTRYTAVAGTEALREAIALKLRRDNTLTYATDEISVGCGAKQVIFNALLATLDAGDQVIVPTPCWVSYPEMVELAGGTPVAVPTEGTAFKLSPAALEAAITPRTKWLMLNSPSNPTGVVYSERELAELGEVLRLHPRVFVLTDDIYEKLLYEGAFATMAAVVPELRERTLTVNGLSKSHAMTGWRVGYGAGPRELIKAINLVQSQSTSHTSSISQAAAVAALTGDDGFLDLFRAQYRRRRDVVLETLGAVPGLRPVRPQGAFYVFVDCRDLIRSTCVGNDTELAMRLLDTGVAVVPGAGFLASPYFRVSYAAATEEVAEGCRRIAAGCLQLTEDA